MLASTLTRRRSIPARSIAAVRALKSGLWVTAGGEGPEICRNTDAFSQAARGPVAAAGGGAGGAARTASQQQQADAQADEAELRARLAEARAIISKHSGLL